MTRFVCLVALVAAVLVAPLAAARRPRGAAHLGRAHLAGPDVVRPRRDAQPVTPFMVLYAHARRAGEVHARHAQGNGLAESWSVSKDGLVYEFVLRKGVKFHNGEPVTAEDVKFSFERYRGAAAKLLKQRVAARGGADPRRVRFRLKQPWLDFMTFFATPGDRRGLDRAEEVRGEGRRRGLQEGAGRRRPVQVRLVQAGRRAGAGGPRGLLAQAAARQDARLPRHPRRVHAAGRAQARRGRHRLLDHRRARRGAQEARRGSSSADAPHVHHVAALHRPVGPEVAVARQARAPGRQPRHRPAGHQPGRVPGPRQAGVDFVPSGMEYFWAPPPYPYDPRRPSSSSPRPATPTASTRASSSAR